MAGKPGKLDETDYRIVEALRDNARISMRELGRLVNLSGQAAKNRVERLEEAGVLRRFTINVDCPVFGYQVHALLRLKLSAGDRSLLERVKADSSMRVEHCYSTSGKFNFFLDLYFLDMAVMRSFAAELESLCSFEMDIVLDERHAHEE